MSVVSYDFVIIVYMHSPGVTAWSEPNVIVFDLCVYLVFGCVCVCVCVCVCDHTVEGKCKWFIDSICTVVFWNAHLTRFVTGYSRPEIRRHTDAGSLEKKNCSSQSPVQLSGIICPSRRVVDCCKVSKGLCVFLSGVAHGDFLSCVIQMCSLLLLCCFIRSHWRSQP